MFRVFARVFRHVRYSVVAVFVAFVVISIAVVLPNVSTALQVLSLSSVDIFDRIGFVASLYLSLFSNFTFVSAMFTFLTAVLFGMNVSLMLFYIRKRQAVLGDTAAHAAGIGGVASAVLGVGCAACGSVLLTAFVGLSGSAALLTFLPLHGEEFGILGFLLLLLSVWYITKRIDDPLVCPV